jgi:hypothetical protein
MRGVRGTWVDIAISKPSTGSSSLDNAYTNSSVSAIAFGTSMRTSTPEIPLRQSMVGLMRKKKTRGRGVKDLDEEAVRFEHKHHAIRFWYSPPKINTIF